ncbi:Fanconi anemia core complex-associated protein 100 [Osmerus eperlanus]|uniref:Fanconi anemia core complex-associated protein 100 n=1 Tax=Osmerus eperlanus TaxID=29151 RepID=UPI002E168825
MERVCAVETWAEFGCRFPATAQVIRSSTEVLICTGNNEIYVFNKEELKLTAVLQFPAHVCHLVLSEDKQLLYTVCDKQGVYCVNLASLLPRNLAPSSVNQTTDQVLLNVTSDRLAVRDEEVCSVILVGRTLLTVSLCETAWLFSIYRTPSSSAPDHQRISQFSLPAVLAFLHDDSKENAGRECGMQPVLACVYSSDTAVPLSSLSSSPGDRHFLIETLLFKLLFGVDAALLKSPIILCGLPDGRLCFLPLLFLGQPEPRVRVLHSLDQPITFIGTCVAPEMGLGSRCVVVVGHQGKVVLVHAQEAGPEEGVKVASFSEGCVPGPVVCVCPGQNCLYYSTESDLWVLDLLGGGGEEARPGEGEVLLQAARPSKDQCVETIRCPKSLGISGVIALTGPSYTHTSGAVQLVALSSRGRLQRLLLPQGSKDGGLPQLPPSQVGQKIRDLLAAIGDVWERASVLKSTNQSRNQTLKRLNQVLNISCLLLAYRSHGERTHTQQKPIRCGVVPSWSRLLQRDSLTLTCVLENSSPYVLEDGWTLCVQVMPLSRSFAEGGGNTFRTFSFRLSRLEAGEKTDVSLPLTTAVDTSFPITVSCSLVFSLQSLLGREEMAGLLANGKTAVSALGLDNTGYVSLALDMLTVDWLDALKVKGDTAPPGITFGHSVSTDTVAMDTIQAYLSSCGFMRAGRGEGAGGAETEGRLFSARVVVSSEILRSALKPGPPDSASLGVTVSPGLGSLVLDWLLSQGPGGQERTEGGDQRGLGSPLVYAMAPGGHPVKLTVTEVAVGEVRLEEGILAAVEVKVESSSIAAVCGLHHAVLHRVQVLLQSVAGTYLSSMSVQGLGLRQALQRAEALLEKIQESRIPEAFGQETISGQVTTTLLSAYRQIRENPLIIT